MENIQVETKKVPLARGLKYGSIAGIVYFFIAFFANWNHPLELRIQSSLSHGLFCMGMTFFSTSMMEFFFNRFEGLMKKYIFAVLFSGCVSLTLMISVHLVMGTPEVFTTVFASAITSTPYYLLFPLKLVFEYEEKIDRFAYRRDENYRREWQVQKVSRPYNLKDFLKVVLLNLTKISMKNPAGVESLEKNFKIKEGSRELRIGFLGDLMPMYKYGWRLSDEVRGMLGEVDYLVCNFEGLLEGLLEGTLSGERQKVLLSQNHNTGILESLKEFLPAEKIILSVANNHSADYGYDYFNQNFEALKREGFKVVGSRDVPSILLDEGINLVAATEWSNQHHGYLSFLEYSVKHVDKNNFNLLYPHWGHELEFYPREKQVRLAKELLNDFDAIVGHHTHIPGPISKYEVNGEEKIVAYSLGDSATGLFRRRYRYGMALTLDFGRNDKGRLELLEGKWCFTQLQKEEGQSYILKEIENYPV